MAKHMHTLEASSIRYESFELARVLLVLLALLLLQLLELLLSSLLLLIVLGLNTRIDCLIVRLIAMYEFDILYCTACEYHKWDSSESAAKLKALLN